MRIDNETLLPSNIFQILYLKAGNEDDVQNVLVAMRTAASDLDKKPIVTSFKGTGRFDNQNSKVVFAVKAEGTDTIKDLHASLQREIRLSGFDIDDGKSFFPNLTLLTTKTKDEELNIKEELYKDEANVSFGTQVSTSLQLISMNKVGPDGYYKVLGSVPFAVNEEEESADHSKCCYDPIQDWKSNRFRHHCHSYAKSRT